MLQVTTYNQLHGFQTWTIQRTGEGRGSRFLRTNHYEVKINLILVKI